MQDQFVGMERVLAKEKVMLDQHEHGVARSLEMLVEELVRQHEAHTRAGIHIPTIEGPPWDDHDPPLPSAGFEDEEDEGQER